jgi:hypothetical protein
MRIGDPSRFARRIEVSVVRSAPLLASGPQVVPRLSPPAVRKRAADTGERGDPMPTMSPLGEAGSETIAN